LDDDGCQRVLDEEHLRLLSLFYKVSAGMAALYGSFGLFYIAMGLVFTLDPSMSASGGDTVGLIMFTIFGLVFLIIGWGTGVLRWLAGVRLSQRRGLLFCQIVAGLSCLEVPYGTAVGVSTFIVLSRPSVRALFSQDNA
jgi:hypothetical protein